MNILIEVGGVKLSMTLEEAREIWGQLNSIFGPETLLVPYHRMPNYWEWPVITSGAQVTTDLISRTEMAPASSDKYTVILKAQS